MPSATVGPVVTYWQNVGLKDAIEQAKEYAALIKQIQNQKVTPTVAAAPSAQLKNQLTADNQFFAKMLKQRADEGRKVDEGIAKLRTRMWKQQFAEEQKAAQEHSQRLNQIFKTSAGAISQMDAPLRGLSTLLNNAGTSLTRVGQIAATAAYRLQILVAPIQALLAVGAKGAVDLDTQLRRAFTQLDDMSGPVDAFVTKYTGAFNEIAVATGQSADQIATGFKFILSSMDTTQEGAAAMQRPLAEFATATGADVVKAATAMSSVFNNFGSQLARFGGEGEQANHILGVFFNAIKEGRAEVDDFTSGFGRVSAAGKLANATFEESAAVFAFMSRIFTSAQAATTTENLFTALTKQGKDAAEAINELGVYLYDLQGTRRNAIDVLVDMFERLARLPEMKQDSFLNRIFGTQRSVRGAITLQDVEFLQKIVDAGQQWEKPDAANNLEKAFGVMLGATETKVSRLGQLIKALTGDAFRGQQSGINRVLDGIVSLLERVQKGGQRTVDFFTKLALGLSALPPIFLAASTATITLGVGLQALGTLVSPAGLLTAVGLWAVFGENIQAIVPAIQEAVSDNGLKGLVRLVINLAAELGILSSSDAATILEAFGLSIDRLDTQKFRDLVDAFEGLREKLGEVKGFITDVVTEFDTFMGMVENRQGIVGGFIGVLEDLGTAVKNLAKALGVEIETNLFDILAALAIAATIAPGVAALAGSVRLLASALAALPLGALGILVGLAGGATALLQNQIPATVPGQGGEWVRSINPMTGASQYTWRAATPTTTSSKVSSDSGKLWGLPASAAASRRLPYYGTVMKGAGTAQDEWMLTGAGTRPIKVAATTPSTGGGGGGGIPLDTGAGDKAADKIKSALESIVKSVLSPTDTGATDPYKLLDQMGRHIDTPDEAARRLASVMMYGRGSDWVDYIKGLGILPEEAFTGSDMDLRAAAAKAYADFQEGLLPQLYDEERAYEKAKRLFLGTQNMDALAAKIMARFGYSMEAAGGLNIPTSFSPATPGDAPLLDAIKNGAPLTTGDGKAYPRAVPYSWMVPGLTDPFLNSTTGYGIPKSPVWDNYMPQPRSSVPTSPRAVPYSWMVPGLTDPFLGGTTGFPPPIGQVSTMSIADMIGDYVVNQPTWTRRSAGKGEGIIEKAKRIIGGLVGGVVRAFTGNATPGIAAPNPVTIQDMIGNYVTNPPAWANYMPQQRSSIPAFPRAVPYGWSVPGLTDPFLNSATGYGTPNPPRPARGRGLTDWDVWGDYNPGAYPWRGVMGPRQDLRQLPGQGAVGKYIPKGVDPDYIDMWTRALSEQYGLTGPMDKNQQWEPGYLMGKEDWERKFNVKPELSQDTPTALRDMFEGRIPTLTINVRLKIDQPLEKAVTQAVTKQVMRTMVGAMA